MPGTARLWNRQLPVRRVERAHDGWHERQWEDLARVEHYRRFLAEPRRYLRHLVDDED